MTASDHMPAPFRFLLYDWGHPYMTRYHLQWDRPAKAMRSASRIYPG